MFCLGSFISKHVLMWMTDERSTKQKRMDDCMRNSESGNGKNSLSSISYVRLPQKSEKFTLFSFYIPNNGSFSIKSMQ